MTCPAVLNLHPTFTIVVVDDDTDDFDLTAIACRQEQLSVRLLHIADQATWQQFIKQEPPTLHLFLLDYRLPQTSGLALLREIKANPSLQRVPVVIWSGGVGEPEMQACYEAGADAFLEKPTNMQLLRQQMQQLTQRLSEPLCAYSGKAYEG